MLNSRPMEPKRETQVSMELGKLRETVDLLEKVISELSARTMNVRVNKGTPVEGGVLNVKNPDPAMEMAPLAIEIKEVYKKINGQISNITCIIRELEV